ncbi:MAG: signal recognition particle-docking protein FtsY [Christensenellaceae bacterium]|nr:signal recognition particle-docking protein FtsY [Christensenellaceae bacterium]
MSENKSFFQRLKDGLFKSRANVADKVDELVENTRRIDDDFYEELVDILVLSDVGGKLSDTIVNNVRKRVNDERVKEAKRVKEFLKEELLKIIDLPKPDLRWPMVQLIVGVNGVGKTTTVGKLAVRFTNLGRTVMMCAADTFRAAASQQLSIWADRANVPIIKHAEGADPAAVLFDAIQAAKSKKADLLLVDTAGRLHNKKNLMDEMNKLRRVIDREYPEAEVRSLMVLDATTGQNGLVQAQAFSEFANINGVVLTKMDGTAKGGIAFAISQELKVPIMYVGVGEGIDDLQAFNAKEFVDALLGED